MFALWSVAYPLHTVCVRFVRVAACVSAWFVFRDRQSGSPRLRWWTLGCLHLLASVSSATPCSLLREGSGAESHRIAIMPASPCVGCPWASAPPFGHLLGLDIVVLCCCAKVLAWPPSTHVSEGCTLGSGLV